MLQLHAVAAFRPREDRRCLGDTGLEFLAHAGLHVDACHFKDHVAFPYFLSRLLVVDGTDGRSELLEQPAAADDAVGHAQRPHRMPCGRDVDRDAGLAHHLLDRGEEIAGRKIGADLDDGIDVVAIELLEHGADHVAARHVRDRGGAAAAQALETTDLEAGLAEEALHLLVADRLVRREHGEALGVEAVERVHHRVGAGGETERTDLALHGGEEFGVALDAAPERFRRHPHHDVGHLGAHQVGHGLGDGRPDAFQEALEGGIAREVRVVHREAPEMPGDARDGEALAVVFHADIG